MNLQQELKTRRDDLERMADEIRVRVHLAKAEEQAKWKELEPKIQAFVDSIGVAKSEANRELQRTGKELMERAQRVWSHIQTQTERQAQHPH